MFKNKVGLDFGCGCGRNVINIVDRFKRMDGVDISQELVQQCIKNLNQYGYDDNKTSFYVCNGISLDICKPESYDFIMSTIVLQHICVYEIRYNYLAEFYRILKPGGMISIQMGFGDGHPNTRDYYENFYDADTTNGSCDVKVDNPEQIIKDLSDIGFTYIEYLIRSSYSDLHNNWIYVKAYKY